MGDEHIKDSPFALLVAPNDHVESGNCYVEGIADSIAGVPVTVIVHSVDAFGNHSVSGGAKVAVHLSGAADIAAEVKDNGDGTYSASYTPTVAGEYTIDVKVNDAAVKENPFKITVSPSDVDPAHCVAEGAGLSKANVAKESRFKIFLRDRFDNKVPFPPGTTTEGFLEAEGQEKIVCAIKSNGDDSFDGSYKMRRPGNWKLTLNVNGKPVKNSPFTVKINPGAVHVPNSVVDKKDGVASKPGTRITLQDVEGNKRHKGGQKVTAQFERPLEQHGGARDNGDGTFDLIYPSDAKGDYKVKVFVGGQEVPGGAIDVKVDENELDEETKKTVTETLPNSGETVARLLKQATDEERAAFVGELNALKSGVAPSDNAAAAETDKLKQNLEVMQAKEAKLKEHNKQLEDQNKDLEKQLEEATAAAAAAPAPAAAAAPADDEEKNKLKSEVDELKAQLAAAKAAPAPAAAEAAPADDSKLKAAEAEKEALASELKAAQEEKDALSKRAEHAESEAKKAAEINEYLQKKLAEAEAAAQAAKEEAAASPKAAPAAEEPKDAASAEAAPAEEAPKPKKRSSKKDVKADVIEKKPEEPAPEPAPAEEKKSARGKDKKSSKDKKASEEKPKEEKSSDKKSSKSKKK